MKRVYFLYREDRDKFFDKIKVSKKSWSKVASYLGTNRSMIESYRSGKLHLPFNRFSLLLALFTEEDKKYFNSKIKEKESNWGQKIGGKRAYKINKEKFDLGRKKGAMASKDM